MTDFLKVLIREMKEGFSAQAQQFQNMMMWALSLRNTTPPSFQQLGEHATASQQHLVMPGVGLTQYPYTINPPSQGFTC